MMPRAGCTAERRRLLACAGGAAVSMTVKMMGGLAGSLAPSRAGAAPAPWNASWPRVPDVTLLDHRGDPVALKPLLGAGPVAMNFIYTGCSSFCPPQTAIFRQLQTLMEQEPALPATLVSLSIDPLGDSPAALARYAQRFDAHLGTRERWLMLTGGPAGVRAVDEVQRAFGAHAAALEEHPAQVWLGCAPKARALRTLGVARASDLLAWLRAAAA